MVLPELCEIPSNGVWPAKCWLMLDAYDIVADGNTEIGTDLALALKRSDASYDALLGAAKVQQEVNKIYRDLLERERQAHTQDNWFYRSIIALGLLGAVL